MIQSFALPFLAAGLMAMAWVSTLGGSPTIIVSGLVIFCLDFWLVLVAQRRAGRRD